MFQEESQGSADIQRILMDLWVGPLLHMIGMLSIDI